MTTRSAPRRRWCGSRCVSALSDRAAEGKLIVVDDWGMTEPKTKRASSCSKARSRNVRKADGATSVVARRKGAAHARRFERNPRVLIVLFRTEQDVWKSLRNLGERVQIVLPEELNTYDVLLNDWLVFSKASLEATVARLRRRRRRARRATTPSRRRR